LDWIDHLKIWDGLDWIGVSRKWIGLDWDPKSMPITAR